VQHINTSVHQHTNAAHQASTHQHSHQDTSLHITHQHINTVINTSTHQHINTSTHQHIIPPQNNRMQWEWNNMLLHSHMWKRPWWCDWKVTPRHCVELYCS
jgi:hypothetical protein